MDNIRPRMFHGNLSFISSCVFIVIVFMPDVQTLNLSYKTSHLSQYVKTGSRASASIKRVKFMPINTFLKIPQSDFRTAAESFRVLCKPLHHSWCTRTMQCVRKAVTVLVLLFAVQQLQCISSAHLVCVFMREWNWAVARAQALLSSHPCTFIASKLCVVALMLSNLAISQTVLRSGLSQQHMLGSLPNRHFRCYCSILTNSGKWIETAVLPAWKAEISL